MGKTKKKENEKKIYDFNGLEWGFSSLIWFSWTETDLVGANNSLLTSGSVLISFKDGVL